MGVASDDEDLVVYGTPIEREEDTSARKRRAVAEAGQLRALPAWKQEVRDEEGRRRFHGAFTGGFSAGFYNTVGSKEGWTPQTFTSSRKNRAELTKQSIYNFLDEEDIKDMGGNALETSQQYDTFGFTAAEYARKQASKEQKERPSAIPGPIPDELVVPTTNSIGVTLLMKMGWRQGRSIRDSHADSLYESRRNARKAFLALSGAKDDEDQDQSAKKPSLDKAVVGSVEEIPVSGNTPVYVLHPKEDFHGLGYDPFKHAPEFRERKTLQKSRERGHERNDVSMRGNLLISNSGNYAPGFGIGALEELDVEDEDIYASGFAYEQTEVDIEPSKAASDSNYKLDDKKRGFYLSFKIASKSEYKLERFPPPVIPDDFDAQHKFSTPVQSAEKFSDSAPLEVPPPEDTSLTLLIDGCAAMVARCGKHIEDFYKEKSKTNLQFLFLSGGDGCNYYMRKLWEHQQKHMGQQRHDSAKSKTSDKLTAENRGKILGERPLDRTTKLHSPSLSVKEAVQLQSNLTETFVKPISLDGLPESEKPFSNDPAKQVRFEQFLRDKYKGGLRAANVTPTSTMSEADRARERLDFEAAAEAIEKGKGKKVIDPLSVFSLPGMNEQRFVAATQPEISVVIQDEKPIYPQREQFEWRPSPILCKRFDIVDPFMGKPMPVQRPRSKMENLIFMTESNKGTKDEVESSSRSAQRASMEAVADVGSQGATNDPDFEPSSLQRPVDLYKAIFSDDSDDDADDNQPVDPVKTSEGANMALNRLVAEDFLESLGKELGLEVPPERPHVSSKPEKLSAAGASLPSQDEMITTALTKVKENQCSIGMVQVVNINEDTPLTSAETLGMKYEKQENRTEKNRSRPMHQQSQNHSPRSNSSSKRHRSWRRKSHRHLWNGTPESESSGERHRSRRRKKSHSRHRKGKSRSPDSDTSSDTQHDRKRKEKRHRRTYTSDTDSSDHEHTERYKSSSRRSSDKDRSRKRPIHHKHRRKDHVDYS